MFSHTKNRANTCLIRLFVLWEKEGIQMIKHAYLIMTHGNWDNLKCLVKSLDYEEHDIYIHIDKKTKEIPFEKIKSWVHKSNIFFVARTNIHWGGYSQIDATINLLEESFSKHRYRYYHLLSGVDMPLSNSKEIYNFFSREYPKEFVRFESFSKNNGVNFSNYYKYPMEKKYLNRIKYFYLRDFGLVKLSRRMTSLINKFIIQIEKLLTINRLKNNDLIFQKGTNWFSVTDEFTCYILKNKKDIKKIYRFSNCADEVFVQTSLINSKYFKNLYSFDNNSNKRYIDWERGNPYTFTVKDYEELMSVSHEYLFTRKVTLDLAELILKNNLSNSDRT